MTERAKILSNGKRADRWSAEFIAVLGSWRDEIKRPQARPIAKKKDPLS